MFHYQLLLKQFGDFYKADAPITHPIITLPSIIKVLHKVHMQSQDALKLQINSSRIRTIHQMSMVPVKRSEFSGNSSMSLPIMTANLQPAAIRRVSEISTNMTKHKPFWSPVPEHIYYTLSAPSSEQFWLSVFCCCGPINLEVVARQSSRPSTRSQHV